VLRPCMRCQLACVCPGPYTRRLVAARALSTRLAARGPGLTHPLSPPTMGAPDSVARSRPLVHAHKSSVKGACESSASTIRLHRCTDEFVLTNEGPRLVSFP
jgi:hypothetical protein